MTALVERAHRMRHDTLPAHRDLMSEQDYILLTCDADVAITAADIENARTVDRLLGRLNKVFEKLDGEVSA